MFVGRSGLSRAPSSLARQSCSSTTFLRREARATNGLRLVDLLAQNESRVRYLLTVKINDLINYFSCNPIANKEGLNDISGDVDQMARNLLINRASHNDIPASLGNVDKGVPLGK